MCNKYHNSYHNGMINCHQSCNQPWNQPCNDFNNYYPQQYDNCCPNPPQRKQHCNLMQPVCVPLIVPIAFAFLNCACKR